jgi:hypothetical protein
MMAGMSAYGPALFVTRTDGAALSGAERAALLDVIARACRRLGFGGSPRAYGEAGFLLYSDYGYHQMPAAIRAEQDESWAGHGRRVGEEIEQRFPGVYAFRAYAVED